MSDMMKGNEAIAEAAVRAGVKFYAGYPITPSSEIMEYLSWSIDCLLRTRHITKTGRGLYPVR